MRDYKIAFLTSQLIADQAPLFQKLAKYPEIDLTVYFCWDIGVHSSGLEKEFNIEMKYDYSLLEGYKYKFLKNYSPRPSTSFFGQINPGIVFELFHNRYDAIIVHGYSHLSDWLAFLGGFLTRTPIFLRGETVLRPNRPFWIRAIKWLAFRPLFKIISALLLMGNWSEKFYLHYGVPKRKMFFVPSAVDNEKFRKVHKELGPQRKKIRGKLNIKENDVVILFVGKLVERKKPFDLLKAYELLNMRKSDLPNIDVNFRRSDFQNIHFQNIHLLFVGDGILRPELENYAKKRNLKNVCFVGFKNQPELFEYYAISDIFVLPSDSAEVCPVVINEAMAFGLPVVVSDAIPSVSGFVKHGENGYIFPVGDVKKLAEYLLDLIKNPKKRKKFGEKSLEIIKNYSYDRDVEGILEALTYVKNN